MHVIRTRADFKAHLRSIAASVQSTALVPTMGYLHEGHLSLMDEAAGHADHVLATIFVNPTQFAAGEDLSTYPRDSEGDLAKLSKSGVSCVFMPSIDEMYDGGPSVRVAIPSLSNRLCGLSRPEHFDGVCQIVLKLLLLAECDYAVFGEKDFQQLTIIRRLVADLNVPTHIIGSPIVRETDGLAMSSRNVYLTPEEREQAIGLSRSLKYVQSKYLEGETSVNELIQLGRHVIGQYPLVKPEYLEIVDANTLQSLEVASTGSRVLVAARLNQTRLIDNLAL